MPTGARPASKNHSSTSGAPREWQFSPTRRTTLRSTPATGRGWSDDAVARDGADHHDGTVDGRGDLRHRDGALADRDADAVPNALDPNDGGASGGWGNRDDDEALEPGRHRDDADPHRTDPTEDRRA